MLDFASQTTFGGVMEGTHVAVEGYAVATRYLPIPLR
jgi:hypothetical protein